uniref:Uncharacterized protein n=2 Tax=Aegilops tauschii subsp. strangulata TaxID=200361 RepID=A0A453BBK8_AEGTS
MLVQEATNTLPRYSIWITLVAAKPSVVLPAVKSRWSSLSFCMVHLLCTEHFGDDILCLLQVYDRSLEKPSSTYCHQVEITSCRDRSSLFSSSLVPMCHVFLNLNAPFLSPCSLLSAKTERRERARMYTPAGKYLQHAG